MKTGEIKHSNLSERAGRVRNAFNKTFNQVEDLRLSSFIRYWVTFLNLANELNEMGSVKYDVPDFNNLVDQEIQNIVGLLSELSLYQDNLGDLVQLLNSKEDKSVFLRELFNGLKVHVESMKAKKVITEEEYRIFIQLITRGKLL